MIGKPNGNAAHENTARTHGQLAELADSCLAEDFDQRPADAGAVAAELSHYFESQRQRLVEAEVSQARAEARAVAEIRRRRLVLALSFALTFAILGLSAATGLRLMDKVRANHRRQLDMKDASARVTAELIVPADQLMATARPSLQHITSGEAFLATAEEQMQSATLSEDTKRILHAKCDQIQTFLIGARRRQEFVDGIDRLLHHIDLAKGRFEENLDGSANAMRTAAKTVLPDYHWAFGNLGFDHKTDVESFAASLAEHDYRVAAVQAAVHEWGMMAYCVSKPKPRAHFQKVAACIDPDSSIRLALWQSADNMDAVCRMVDQLQILEDPVAVRIAFVLLSQNHKRKIGIRLLEHAMIRNPGDFQINRELTITAMRKRPSPLAHSRAMEHINICRATHPNHAPSCIAWSNILKFEKEHKFAIEMLKEASKNNPQHTRLKTHLADHLIADGGFQEAEQELAEAQANSPNDMHVLFAQGLLHARQRNVKRAEQLLEYQHHAKALTMTRSQIAWLACGTLTKR